MLGAALVRRLEQGGYTEAVRPGIDLSSQEAVGSCFRTFRPEAVLFTGGRSGGIQENRARPSGLVQDNLLAQAHVFEAALATGVGRLLYLASACVYPRDCPQPMREESLLSGPFEPTNDAYAVAKVAGIFQCLAASRQHGVRYLPVIPTNVYGPGDEMDPERSHVVGSLMARMRAARAKGGRLEVWGTGAPVREFLYVDDLADALAFLLERDPAPEVLNVASGEEVSVADLARRIRDVTGFPGELAFDASKPDGMPRKSLDGGRLAALGWRARTPLDEGLRRTWDWFRAS